MPKRKNTTNDLQEWYNNQAYLCINHDKHKKWVFLYASTK